MSSSISWAARLRRAACLLALLPLPVLAGAFSVMPIRLDLGGALRSAALTVHNEDSHDLSFSVRLALWTQDEAGQDHYEDSNDLVYFPRLLTLAPGQEAVVRVGLRQGLVPVEKAYRLFVEELPPARAMPELARGPNLRVTVRFGAPVFVRPTQPAPRLVFETLQVSGGVARWSARNEGNAHDRFERMALRGFDAQGAEVFLQEIPARYVLAGRTQHFSIPLPAASCGRAVRVVLGFAVEQGEQQQPAVLDTPACP